MKTIKIAMLAIAITGLSACGDGMAPPEVEHAIRQSHSARSRQDRNASGADQATEGQSGKRGESGSGKGKKGQSSSSGSQFVIIPGESKPADQ